MINFLEAYEEIGRDFFNDQPGTLQLCPIHRSNKPSLRIFPEAGLFRCHVCGFCVDGKTLLDLKKGNRPERELIIERGRSIFLHNVKYGQEADLFGDCSSVEVFDLPIVFPGQPVSLGEFKKTTVRSIRNVFGQEIAQQMIWNKRFNRRQIPTKVGLRRFLFPRWVDFLPLQDVIVTSHETIALTLIKAMRAWPAPNRIPIISMLGKEDQTTSLKDVVFSRVWFVHDAEDRIAESFQFLHPGSSELQLCNIRGMGRQDVVDSFSSPDCLFDHRWQAGLSFVEKSIQDLDDRGIAGVIRPFLRRKEIPEKLKQIIRSMAGNELRISEILDPLSAWCGAKTWRGPVYLREGVYVLGKRRCRNTTVISNFSIRVMDRSIEDGSVIWKLVLEAAGRSCVFEVPDALFFNSEQLWARLGLEAAKNQMCPPVFFRSRFESLLPSIIKQHFST